MDGSPRWQHLRLAPDTTYEIEASLTDPDGADATHVISATTRAVLAGSAGAPIIAATPDTIGAVLSRAQPGDIIELGAGDYTGFNVDRSGVGGQPIVLSGRVGATVNGEIGIFDQSHVHVEDLTVNGRIRFNGSDHVAITGNTINATVELEGHGIVTFA